MVVRLQLIAESGVSFVSLRTNQGLSPLKKMAKIKPPIDYVSLSADIKGGPHAGAKVHQINNAQKAQPRGSWMKPTPDEIEAVIVGMVSVGPLGCGARSGVN